MLLSKNIGNIYTGSLYIGLASLLNEGNLIGKRVLMFSYGSGLMSSMFTLRIRQNVNDLKIILNIEQRLRNRIQINGI